MWVTMPWAFLDKVVSFKQRQWLNAATKLFFASGVWFTAAAILDTTGVLRTLLLNASGIAITTSTAPLAPYFAAGLIPLALAMGCAYYVIESISSIGGVDKITVVGATMEIGTLLTALLIDGLNVVFLYQFYPVTSFLWPQRSLILVFVASLPVSILASILSIAFMVTGRTYATTVSLILAISPYIVAFLVALLLEAGVSHF